MDFDNNEVFLSGIIAGMIGTFLFSQPFMFRGLITFKNLVYAYLPDALAHFLWSQSLGAIVFFWFIIIIGFLIWIIRGDIFAYEDKD